MRIDPRRVIAVLLCALTLSCTDPSPTFVFDAAIDVPRDVAADVRAVGGASGSGAGGSGVGGSGVGGSGGGTADGGAP